MPNNKSVYSYDQPTHIDAKNNVIDITSLILFLLVGTVFIDSFQIHESPFFNIDLKFIYVLIVFLLPIFIISLPLDTAS